MKSISPFGLLTCFIFSMVLNGAPANNRGIIKDQSESSAFVINHSPEIIYYKPESKASNPGLDPDGAYPLAPGESLYQPVDGVATSVTTEGKIYRVPTGSRIIINEHGVLTAANIIAKAGLFLPYYGIVYPPSPNFAKLANTKIILYRFADINRKNAVTSLN
jgi:hypothetical protein